MFVNFTLTLTHNFVDHHHRCPLSGDLLSRSNVFSLAEPSLTNDSDSLLTLIIIKVVNNYPKRGHRTAVPEPPEGCRLQCGAMRFGLIGATVFFLYYRVPTATLQLQVQKSTSATKRNADAYTIPTTWPANESREGPEAEGSCCTRANTLVL